MPSPVRAQPSWRQVRAAHRAGRRSTAAPGSRRGIGSDGRRRLCRAGARTAAARRPAGGRTACRPAPRALAARPHRATPAARPPCWGTARCAAATPAPPPRSPALPVQRVWPPWSAGNPALGQPQHPAGRRKWGTGKRVGSRPEAIGQQGRGGVANFPSVTGSERVRLRGPSGCRDPSVCGAG